MKQSNMINEHLKNIYIFENASTYLNKMTANAPKIGKALASLDILKLYNSFAFANDLEINELVEYTKKSFKSNFNKNRKVILDKLGKKTPSDIIDLLTIYYTGIVNLNTKSDEPSIKEKINESLEHFDNGISILKKYVKSDGVSIIGVAHVIEHLVKGGTFLPTQVNTKNSKQAGISLLSTYLLTKMFIDAKKQKIKVIQ